MSLRDAIRTPPHSVGLTLFRDVPTDPSKTRTNFSPMEFVAPQYSNWFSYVDFSENTVHLFIREFPHPENSPYSYEYIDFVCSSICSYFKVREAVLYCPTQFPWEGLLK